MWPAFCRFCSCKVGLSATKGATDTYEHLAELAKELNPQSQPRYRE